MKVNNLTRSKLFKIIIIVFFLALIGLVLFQANEHHTNQAEDKVIERNGVAGKIVSISYPYITVGEAENYERTIVVQDDTVVRQFENEISGESLKIGDYIDVKGEPNVKGMIQAQFINLLPAPPDTVN